MGWSLNVEANVRDVKPALVRGRDAWIEENSEWVSDEAKTQVGAAITAAEILILSGAVGRGGVSVALSGVADAHLITGTVSISVTSIAEDKPVIAPLNERAERLLEDAMDRNRQPGEDSHEVDFSDIDDGTGSVQFEDHNVVENLVVETGNPTEPKGETTLPAEHELRKQMQTLRDDAELQVQAGVRDASFIPSESAVVDVPETDAHVTDPSLRDVVDTDDDDEDSDPTKADLQERLRERGLPVSGTKAELQERLDGVANDGTGR